MSPRFQFSLRTLLIGCACVALVCAGVSRLRYAYYVQLRTVNAALAEFPEIDKVWLCTNADLTLEVEGLWFSTVDQPKAVFQVKGFLDGATTSEIRAGLRRALLHLHPTQLPAYATYRLR